MMVDDLEIIVTDKQLNKAWGNANFGSMSKREVIKLGVLKCASGFYQCFTSKQILKELELITEDYELTKKGMLYLWSAFSDGSNF